MTTALATSLSSSVLTRPGWYIRVLDVVAEDLKVTRITFGEKCPPTWTPTGAADDRPLQLLRHRG
jgi:hypothetical protein